jgi:hypothetical protein
MLFVPCQQDVSSVRFFACTISVLAYPTALEHAGFRCAGALRCDGRRASNGFARASCASAAGISQCVLLHSVCNSACTVDGRIAARTASVRKRAAQISIAHCAGHACSSPAPVESLHLWTSRRACIRLRVRNSACDGRVAAPVYIRFTCQCNGIRAETIAASLSKRIVSDSQRLRCDGRS